MDAVSSGDSSAASDRRRRFPSDRRLSGRADEGAQRELTGARRAAWITLLAWTILAVLSWRWDAFDKHGIAVQLARTEAESHLSREIALRDWIGSRGGIYVADDGRTPPNPYMAHVPDQTVVSSSGKRLTLVSTSYLTRLLQQDYVERAGVVGHLSGPKPLNPDNQPREWERPAYAAFAAGESELGRVAEDGGKEYYGLVRALRAKPLCFKCHTEPGLKEGDVLGAISVLVTLEPYRNVEGSELRNEAVAHGVIWLMGCLGILTAFRVGLAYLRERHRQQKALVDSHALFQTIADQSTDWIFWRNPDGSFRYISPACQRISGYSPEEFAADPGLFLGIVHPDDREGFSAHIGQVDQGQDAPPLELRILTREGKVRYIAHSCRPIHDEAGRFVGVRGANHDITSLRENEQILINQSRHAAMGEMISNIAHQWRQPISAVGLVLQNLEYDYREGRLTPEDLHGYISRGRELIGRMSATIDDFRNFFRPEHERSRFEIQVPVREAIRIVQDSFRAHGIEIRWSDGEACQVYGYPNELAQVLLNLLANAKDAIVGRGLSQGVVDLQTTVAGDEVLLVVRDNGGGIPAEVLPRIFDPYFTTKANGTGIGLYMSATIVGHMGGKLAARNVDGGAEFTLRLPLARDAREVAP